MIYEIFTIVKKVKTSPKRKKNVKQSKIFPSRGDIKQAFIRTTITKKNRKQIILNQNVTNEKTNMAVLFDCYKISNLI